MTLWWIIYKSLRQHAFSTLLTAFSIALAGGLLMSVWAVREQSHAAFTGMSGGFDAVLGARSAKLQLVLNAIFHLEESPGNLAWPDYLEIQANPNVALAVPIAMGDNYRGYRLVGTTTNFFTKAEYAPGKRCTPRAPGRIFDPAAREAVVGSLVAQKLGLKRGDVIHPFHGLQFDEEKEHSETYLIVGVLEPTNTPADRVIWIPLEGLQKMSGHDPQAASDVSAVLIQLKAGSAVAGQRLSLFYNKEGNRLTFAWPIGQIMAQLFGKIAWFDRVLELVAYLVALVATGSILASIYNSMNERRREIAILRALGAHRRTVFSSIILEAATIAALGMVIGFAFYSAIMTAVASVVRAQTGIVLDPLAFHAIMIWAPLGLIGLSALSGIVPAVKAYRTDVAENLAPIS
ncbi:MAG: ABC transporter permease [Verrucomicrobia bacterium]|nr:ABC transporter permease [Verrucomicrobiota bacterium]